MRPRFSVTLSAITALLCAGCGTTVYFEKENTGQSSTAAPRLQAYMASDGRDADSELIKKAKLYDFVDDPKAARVIIEPVESLSVTELIEMEQLFSFITLGTIPLHYGTFHDISYVETAGDRRTWHRRRFKLTHRISIWDRFITTNEADEMSKALADSEDETQPLEPGRAPPTLRETNDKSRVGARDRAVGH